MIEHDGALSFIKTRVKRDISLVALLSHISIEYCCNTFLAEAKKEIYCEQVK